jgi:hypothetical protein
LQYILFELAFNTMQTSTSLFFALSIISFSGVEAARASAQSLHQYIASIPASEPHHVCLTGNRAAQLMQSFIMVEGHELSNYEMQSKVSETKCTVKDYKIANTLFLVSDELSEGCAARWKAHSQSCDVLVHAHDGKDCDLLYKFRLITDQCDAPLVVVHSDKELVQCYSDRVAQARKDFMMPLDDHCTNIHHEVMLHDKDQKGQELVPILRSALQQTSAMVKERYAHLSQSSSMLQHANDTQSLRHLLYRGKRSIHDVHTEFLRRMQDMPHDEIAVSFLHSASMQHSRKQKTQR